MWHTDSSFRPVPAFVSINYVYEAPAESGITEFVSARAAYKRLAEEEKTTIDQLVVVHDYVFSRSKVARNVFLVRWLNPCQRYLKNLSGPIQAVVRKAIT